MSVKKSRRFSQGQSERQEKKGLTESHGSISLEVHGRVHRGIDGELSVVSSKSMTLSVGVREETGLEDRVGSGLNSGDKMRRREGDLLDLGWKMA